MAKAKVKKTRGGAAPALVTASETCAGKAMVDERFAKLERHREMQLKENAASCTALDRLDDRITELVKTVDVLRQDELNNATAIARLQEREATKPATPAEPELPEGWSIKPYTNGGFVLYFGHVGKLTTYYGRDSAVVHAWLEYLVKNHLESFRFHSRRLAVAHKVWWFTNEYGISSPDFKSLEACIRACL